MNPAGSNSWSRPSSRKKPSSSATHSWSRLWGWMRSFAMPGTLAPPAAVVVRRVRLPTRPKLRGEPTAPLDTGGVDAVGSRPMRKMSLTGRTVCVVAALLAGLSAPPVALAQTPAGWQRTDMRPMTQPALAGGLFVMYARGTAGLQVVAVDPATGRTAWSQPASPSEVTQGQGPVLTVAGAEVVFLGRDAGTRAKLTAADARTGAILWQSAPATFTTWPGICGDDATAICVSSQSRTGTSGAELRFDLATGRALPFARIRGDGIRELGVGLIDPGARVPERLVAVAGSGIAWDRPVDRIFSHRVTSDTGWNFGRYGELGLYVGTLGADADLVRASRAHHASRQQR